MATSGQTGDRKRRVCFPGRIRGAVASWGFSQLGCAELGWLGTRLGFGGWLTGGLATLDDTGAEMSTILPISSGSPSPMDRCRLAWAELGRTFVLGSTTGGSAFESIFRRARLLVAVRSRSLRTFSAESSGWVNALSGLPPSAGATRRTTSSTISVRLGTRTIGAAGAAFGADRIPASTDLSTDGRATSTEWAADAAFGLDGIPG